LRGAGDGAPVGDAVRCIWAVVRRIPKGRVATYGQVAFLAGLGRRARQAGYAMRVLPEGSPVPWQRVINAAGRISVHPDPLFGALQRSLLEAEGVEFDRDGKVDLGRFQWHPRAGRRGDPCAR